MNSLNYSLTASDAPAPAPQLAPLVSSLQERLAKLNGRIGQATEHVQASIDAISGPRPETVKPERDTSRIGLVSTSLCDRVDDLERAVSGLEEQLTRLG